jgi:hypothetical protein
MSICLFEIDPDRTSDLGFFSKPMSNKEQLYRHVSYAIGFVESEKEQPVPYVQLSFSRNILGP